MEAYVKELDERKVNMVVVNKADLLSKRQRYSLPPVFLNIL
jgi:ribosome biogenesis GTPase A